MASPPIPLYSMPLEIWLNVLSHLAEPDFLALKRSSAHLRNVIVHSAPTICNTLIITHYAQEAAIIGTALRDGWLVPTHPAIVREEKVLARHSRHARSRPSTSSKKSSRDRPAPPLAANEVIRTNLSEPGPQYLRFLIEYAFEIRVANAMFDDREPTPARATAVVRSKKTSPSPSSSPSPLFWTTEKEMTPQEKFDQWIGLYTVRRFLTRLHKIRHPLLSYGSGSGSREQEEAMLKTTRDGLAWFYC